MTHKMHRRLFVMGTVILLAVLAVVQSGAASAKDENIGIVPPDAKPYSHTYGEWSNLWFQWAYSMPITRGHEQANPLFDTTGVTCSRNQSGPVFFLAGVFKVYEEDNENQNPIAVPVDRTQCVVPEGKALFFPILNIEEDNAWNPKNDEAEIRDALKEYVDDMEDMSASIDGVPVQNLKSYFVSPDNPLTDVTLPANNIYDYYGIHVAPGRYSMMGTAGYYLMLDPLPVGRHVIHFRGLTKGQLAVDMTYHLTVSPGSAFQPGMPRTGHANESSLLTLALVALGMMAFGLALAHRRA